MGQLARDRSERWISSLEVKRTTKFSLGLMLHTINDDGSTFDCEMDLLPAIDITATSKYSVTHSFIHSFIYLFMYLFIYNQLHNDDAWRQQYFEWYAGECFAIHYVKQRPVPVVIVAIGFFDELCDVLYVLC